MSRKVLPGHGHKEGRHHVPAQYMIGQIIVIVTVVTVCWTSGFAQARPECPQRHNIKVSVADQAFDIPIRFSPRISVDGGKVLRPNSPTSRLHCDGFGIGTGDEPIEANQILFIGLTEVEKPKLFLLERVWVKISRTAPYAFDRRSFESFNNGMGLEGFPNGKPPQVHGYYALAQSAGRQEYIGPFMSVPDGVKAPTGQPIVVDCYGARVAPAESGYATRLSPVCRVAYNWSKDFGIQYGFNEADFPIDNWGMLDSAVQNFVTRLLVDPKK